MAPRKSISAPSTTPSTSTPLPQNAPHLLLCEALGFSPQLLLDDIINIANNAVQDGVNGMEEFLQKWADERVALSNATTSTQANAKTLSKAKAQADLEATTHEVEQGLVAFQTLLEYHTDIAFDFFEAWCMRNIFYIPPDLPIVLPHMEGLDLTTRKEEEVEAMEEVERLRGVLDGHRKLNRLLTRAIRTSTRQQKAAEARLSNLSALLPPSFPSPSLSSPHSPASPHSTPSTQSAALQTLTALPPKLLHLYTTLSSLPPLSSLPAPHPAATSSAGLGGIGGLVEPGKRVWETSQTGYVNWALGRLLARHPNPAQGSSSSSPPSSSSPQDGTPPGPGSGSGSGEEGAQRQPQGQGQGIVDRIDRAAAQVGSGEELRSALEVIEGVRRELDEALSRSRRKGAERPAVVGEGGDGEEGEEGVVEGDSSLMMEE